MAEDTFRQWMRENFDDDELCDMVEHGCSGGFSGLVYYTDTQALYNQFSAEIWEMLCDDAQNMGMEPLELIASFNGAKNVYLDMHFENLLVWYAAETIARQLTENDEEV